MIRWSAQPTKCLDVRGGSVHTAAAGALLQTWNCTKVNTNQRFLVTRKKLWQRPATKLPSVSNNTEMAWPQCSCSVGEPRGPSLFCWIVGASNGSGLELMKNALKQKVSIFACDRHTMFSDKVVPLSADGRIYTTSLISASLRDLATSVISASLRDWAWGKQLDS